GPTGARSASGGPDRLLRLFGGHAARVFPDRPNLDGAPLGAWATSAPLNRLVEVCRLDDVVAAEFFLGLSEGTVGHDSLAVADAHGGGCLAILQRLAAAHGAAFDEGFRVGVVGLHDLFELLRRRL